MIAAVRHVAGQRTDDDSRELNTFVGLIFFAIGAVGCAACDRPTQRERRIVAKRGADQIDESTAPHCGLDPDREYILCANGAYRLNAELSVWTDVAEFERLVALAGRHDSAGRAGDALVAYQSADALYRGDYLEGGSCAEWAVAERRRLPAEYVIAGTRLSRLHADVGDHRAALAVCAKVLERDPWNDEVTRCAMRSYVAIGNPSLGLRLFKALDEEMLKELGVAPSAETCELFAQLRSAVPGAP